MTTIHPTQFTIAARKAAIFNARYNIGDPVMHIRAPGAEPVWDRVYGRASVVEGRSMVHLAGLESMVETDQLYAPPLELTPPAAVLRELAPSAWALALAFVIGFAAAVLITTPAHSTAPEHIVIDCDGPDAAPAAAPTEGRAIA